MIDTFRKLYALLTRRERRTAAVVVLLMLASGVLEVIGVASIMPFVTVLAKPEMVQSDPRLAAVYTALGFSDARQFLMLLGVVVFFVFVIALALKALSTYAILRFSMMRLHSISCRLLGAYLRQPYSTFLNRNTAALGEAVLSEVEQATSGALLPALRALAGALTAFGLLALLFVVEPMLSIAVAVSLGGAYVVVYFVTRVLLQRYGEERMRANERRFVLANEALNGIKELRLMGRERAYLQRFVEPSERFARNQASSKVIGQLPQFGIQALAFGGALLTMLYLLGQKGTLQAGLPLLALYGFAGYRLMPAFQELFKSLTEVRFFAPAVSALHEDLIAKERDAVEQPEDSADQARVSGIITMENVSFSYPGAERMALRELDLDIAPGTSAAFVGTTGAGKSTVVDLILGLLVATSGRVLVNGEPLQGRYLRAWQRNIGYVPQVTYLADDTVAANIAFGVSPAQVDRQAVERAARAARIHDFIVEQLPQGYDTMIGERGIRLSGGQRQRLAIARALYHDPDVVVFDEATSALDIPTETAVMEAIEELHGRKTVLLIAHRLSTVRSCDRIFLLAEGRIRTSGTYDELMGNSADFRSLVQHASGAP